MIRPCVFANWHSVKLTFPDGSMVKNPFANAGDLSSIFDSERSPRWEMATTPVSLPGKSHGQRNLVGYSPQGRKESDDLVTKQQLTEVRPLSSQTKWEDSLCENKNLIFFDGYILMG